jgi:deuterolysin
LPSKAFTSLRAGASLTVRLDASHAHDLETGSTYSIISSGHISYALAGSNDLSGSVGFLSNGLILNLPHTATVKRASDSRRSERDRRTVRTIVSDCSDADVQMALEANQQCVNLANAAADRAASDDGKFQEYFATLDGGVRQTVIDRFHAVANECSRAPNGGSTTTHCNDVDNMCSGGTLAYTYPDTGFVVDCPMYFDVLPLLDAGCHRQDRTTTTIHEYTHSK